MEKGEGSQGTRERLLEAAGEVFAEKGYRDATIREIVARAGASLNAVNYHYGDKEQLFAAVLEHALGFAQERAERVLESLEALRPEERLRGFVRATLMRGLAMGQGGWRAKLTAREMMDPTPALDVLVTEYIRPRFEVIAAVVRDLAGDGLTEREIALTAMSIVGQCIHYARARRVIGHLVANLTCSEADVEELTDHITRFSLAGIRKMGERDAISS